MIAIKTLIWSILVPTTATIVIPYLLLTSQLNTLRLPFGTIRWFGLIPILIGVGLYCWSAWGFTFNGKGTPAPFDPPKELVVKGPYRYLRNPMYTFVVIAL